MHLNVSIKNHDVVLINGQKSLTSPVHFFFFFSLGWSDLELMKERFSKLLLGEDMSGGGKGVSSALALSNAITNPAGNDAILHISGRLIYNWIIQ